MLTATVREEAMHRLLIAFVTVTIASAFPVTAHAQFGDFNTRGTTVKSSKSNTSDRTTTVKSSKSNTSDRTTTVKSSKSNTSDRAINLNSSRSNRY